jgi:hypothetical protein
VLTGKSSVACRGYGAPNACGRPRRRGPFRANARCPAATRAEDMSLKLSAARIHVKRQAEDYKQREKDDKAREKAKKAARKAEKAAASEALRLERLARTAAKKDGKPQQGLPSPTPFKRARLASSLARAPEPAPQSEPQREEEAPRPPSQEPAALCESLVSDCGLDLPALGDQPEAGNEAASGAQSWHSSWRCCSGKCHKQASDTDLYDHISAQQDLTFLAALPSPAVQTATRTIYALPQYSLIQRASREGAPIVFTSFLSCRFKDGPRLVTICSCQERGDVATLERLFGSGSVSYTFDEARAQAKVHHCEHVQALQVR